jgi:hypothetical protein
LPLEHPYRNPLMDSLANLKVILEERSSRTPEEQDLFMQLSPLYLEKIAAAEQHGRQETILLLISEKLGSLPPQLVDRVKSLNNQQLQALTASVLSLSSTTDLSNWLDRI